MTGAPAPDLIEAPDDATVDRAVRDFASRILTGYGDRVKGIYLFGSRARGEHALESDADIAIVLADGDWSRWDEKMQIAGMEYDTIVATGAEPEAWLVRESEWRDPSLHPNPALVRAMKRDARPIEVLE